jgi:tRNA(Ile)-lysidine synthase
MKGPETDLASVATRAIGARSGDRIGVAVSGGPDSLAALVLVARTWRERGVPVVALHVDHRLRPQAADAERRLVERVATSLGAGFATRAVDVRAERDRSGSSIEFAARRLRHAALAAMASELALTRVVLAHHREDQLETVLLALLRGAWPGALAGMPRERPLAGPIVLVRPFLDVPREALRAHAAGLDPAVDATNLDPAHRRVAVRSSLLPGLRASDPATDAIVADVAAHARAIDDAAQAGARRLLAPGGPIYAEPGAVVVDARSLVNAGRFATARLLKTLCERDRALGHASWALVRRVERAAAAGGTAPIEVRRGVAVTARAGRVAVYAVEPPDAIEVEMLWEGRPLDRPVDGVRRVRIDTAEPPPGAVAPYRCHLAKGARIVVRPRRAGDRFPLCVGASKAVADEFCDRKIQPAWRTRIPLVFVDGALRWITGVRVIPSEADARPNAWIAISGPVPWV